MLLSPAYSDTFEVMSGPSQTPEHLPRTGGYIDPTEPRWSSLHPSPYLELSHQYQSQQHGSSVLTPVSIADSPYIQPRPSSGVSHFSQEYPYLDDNVVSQGLGVSSSYQEYAPVPTSPPNYNYPQHQQQHPPAADFYNYGSSNVPSLFTLEPSIPKQTKRQMTSNTLSSQRNSPVRILPHPEGMQRLEHERRGGQMVDLSTPEPSKTRPPGRGRRDPQAEEEDIYVENLRAQNLSWKTVAEMFRERYGKNTSEARLQMRMLRRRKSAAAWHEADIPLLHEAHRYWRTAKFGIIAKKLQDLGASQEYSEDQIQSQLKRPRDDESEYELEMTSPEIENRELRSSRTRARTTRKRKKRLNAEQEDHGGEGEED